MYIQHKFDSFSSEDEICGFHINEMTHEGWWLEGIYDYIIYDNFINSQMVLKLIGYNQTSGEKIGSAISEYSILS